MNEAANNEQVADAETRAIEVNGTVLNVVIQGQGPDVLLVHGFPDCHRVWRHQIPALVAAGYRVIAPDTRGCGDSEISSRVSDYQRNNLVEDLIGVLDVLGIDKVRLVGHDWGAAICWQLVLNYPQRVDRYVALSVGHPSAYARAGLLQKLKGYYILALQLRGIAEFMLTCCNWLVFRMMVRYPPEFDNWRATLGRPGRLTAALNYYRANLDVVFARNNAQAKVPVLGIWSSNDIALVEKQMVETAAYVDAPFRYQRIDGASHWLQLDQPIKINSLLLGYLE
jgi:pimeloyl-ACP methyl ester carboxylesterase